MSADRTGRRRLLGALGALPLLNTVSSNASGPSADGPEAIARHSSAGPRDRQEYARLRNLDLDDPAVAARRQEMPTGRIGKLCLGRLISGSNLISMNMHARDLTYMTALAARYNTQERIFMTLKKCEEQGVNAIVLKNHNFRQFDLARYWQQWGSKMQWIADVITTDISQYERLYEEHLELGASAAYLWGGASDTWYYQHKQENIIKAFEIMRKYDVPVGIGAHRIEPILFCEKEGLVPDFYIKTLHHDRYWSAHPQANRRYMEMFEPVSDDHAYYHDNLFCRDHQQTIAAMQEIRVPWIAFKVLAAGAIPPQDGIPYAYHGGADFICLGMFDFQVDEDARIVRDSIAAARSRKRPWM